MNGPNQFFPGLQHVAGVGFIQTGGNPIGGPASSFGDESAVMMISGLGADASQAAPAPVAVDLLTALKTPIRIGAIELPLWTWLLLAMSVGGGVGYFVGRKK